MVTFKAFVQMEGLQEYLKKLIKERGIRKRLLRCSKKAC
jgi:hypothetical protein